MTIKFRSNIVLSYLKVIILKNYFLFMFSYDYKQWSQYGTKVSDSSFPKKIFVVSEVISQCKDILHLIVNVSTKYLSVFPLNLTFFMICTFFVYVKNGRFIRRIILKIIYSLLRIKLSCIYISALNFNQHCIFNF